MQKNIQKFIQVITIFFFINTIFSCSKEEDLKYSPRQLLEAIRVGDPKAVPIAPIPIIDTDNISIITCEHYGKGCLQVLRGNILNYEVIFVEFDDEENAKKDASVRKALYTRNWLIDYAKEEKILVEFFKKYIDAKFAHE
ncbi:MAG: hypothetical protein H6621_01555 [Halobacteriovoraceae bacterium]|nr:hypothetical protein [Halobacteriovoraceae bacterium]